MFEVIPIPAFKDNYLWLVVNRLNQNCLVVDPGSAEPIFEYIKRHKLNLTAVLVTHNHWDHVNGIPDLCNQFSNIDVYGPAKEDIDSVTIPLSGNEEIYLSAIGLTFSVLSVPGHTHGHIAYLNTGMEQPVLFCGDTIFSSGCGRLFNGTIEQLFASLNVLRRLSPATLVYCAHEYTLKNIAFAKAVEPKNEGLKAREAEVKGLLSSGKPTLPTTMGTELMVNPFLRLANPVVRTSAEQFAGHKVSSSLEVLQVLRAWKDIF